jgi:PAS domain S-box-containing protein
MADMLSIPRWRRRLPRSRGLALAGAAVFILLGALDVISYSTLAHDRRSALDTRRDYRTLNLSERALESLQRMESLYREFLVTGQEETLARYEPTRAEYTHALAQLIATSADRTDEQRLWKRVAERAAAWEHEAVAPALRLRRDVTAGRATIEQLVLAERAGNSALYFGEIRALLAAATRSQRSALAEQSSEDGVVFDRIRSATLWGTAILVALGVLIAVTSARLDAALGDLHEADEALNRRDEQLQSVVASVREVIFRTDADGRWQLLTPGWAALTGDAVPDSLGRHFADRIHPEDRARALEAFAAFRASEADEHHDEFRVDAARGIRWVDVHARAERVEGRLVAVDGTLADVTERRALESRLRQAHKMEAMGQLAGGVAHDFNNILTVIHSSAELAAEELMTDPARAGRDLREITIAAQRAASLTKQLLAFSRRNARAPVVLDLNVRLRGCETLLSRLLPPAIPLVLVLDEREPSITIDPNELEQVVMNLVVNARDAMAEGGTIVVETRVAGEHVQLSVTDQGMGMDAATQQRIFEPFFTTKPVGKGTGLGLATVYGILEESGATIDVSSAVGAGTTFRITFALAASVRRVTGEHSMPRVGRGRVLLVDDEARVRETAARTLRRYGYDVFEARHGGDALRIVELQQNIELVVTDLLMPEMGGRELRRRLRERHPGIPVVFMTGYGADGHDLADGVSILEKPFTSSALVRHVQQALDS